MGLSQVLTNIFGASCLLLLVLGFFIELFWFTFLLVRLFRYRSEYNTLVSRWSYNPAEFNIHVFNLKVKIVISSFLLLIITTEFLSGLGYVLGMSSFSLGFQGPEISPFLLNITSNCYPRHEYTWEYELENPLVAFLISFANLSMCLEFILNIALLRFVFLAYQLKTDFRSIKIFLLKSCVVLLFMFIISVIPQTQVFSKIITSIVCITIIYLLFKHRAGYFHILRQRCNDTFGDRDHKIHLRTKRNSIITFNTFLFSYVLFLIALTIDQVLSFLCMIFTEQSRKLTALYNFDMNLAFIPCDYQHIIYDTQDVVSTILPTTMIIAVILYLIPQFAIMFVITGRYLYRQCRGIDSRYIRFEGNYHLYHRRSY